jgi:ubiquinone biosynthesis monooxygenase Coq7
MDLCDGGEKMRAFSFLDRMLIEVNSGLNSIFGSNALSQDNRLNPSIGLPQEDLSDADRRHSAGLLRVDHTGEICAQGLYRGQAFLAKKPETQRALLIAAAEEEDHLVWCAQRLTELFSHRSYLNSFWYVASFLLGVTMASCGDEWSNGFVVETENQVERHLILHLKELPVGDQKSRAILEQMKHEEKIHAAVAQDRGAKTLPGWLKGLMSMQSRVMTTTAYWV